VLAAWDFKERFLARRNAHYWDRGGIEVETIEFYLAPSANSALVAYETQRVDMVRGLDVEVALELEKEHAAGRRRDFHVGDRFATFFLRVNCRRAPLDNVELRRALALAIDKELIAAQALGLGERAADGYVPWHVLNSGAGPSTASAADAGAPVGLGAGLSREQRLTLARRYLESSGFDRLSAARPLELAYTAEPAQFRRVCEAIQAMWERDLGLVVGPRALESRVLSQRIRLLDYDVVRSNWFGDFLDAVTFLEMFTSNSPQNRTGWACERYDALLAAAKHEADAGKRIELLRAAERILCEEELPIIPLYFMRGNYLLDPRFVLTDGPRGVPLFHRVRRAAGQRARP